MAKIHKQMIAVMKACKAIGKAQRNTQGQGYNFRGIDDVYNGLNEILSDNGVFTTSEILSEKSEERKSRNGGVLIYRIFHIEWTFWADDGSTVHSETIGEAMDSGDKASNKAMSVAHKYALLQAFAIPTQEPKDPENENPEPLPRGTTPPPQPVKLPKRTDVQKILKGIKTFDGYKNYVKGFNEQWGNIWKLESKKDQTWEELFNIRKNSILEMEGTTEFLKMTDQCETEEDLKKIEEFFEGNPLIQSQANKNQLNILKSEINDKKAAENGKS